MREDRRTGRCREWGCRFDRTHQRELPARVAIAFEQSNLEDPASTVLFHLRLALENRGAYGRSRALPRAVDPGLDLAQIAAVQGSETGLVGSLRARCIWNPSTRGGHKRERW